jgi:CBS domain-containing protein
VVTVEESDRIDDVVQLMAEHECTHLVVVSAEEDRPVGVVSSLDVAGELTRLRDIALTG